MNRGARQVGVWLTMLGTLLALRVHCADLVLSEILVSAPGTDTPNEYIELRGTPNYLIPPGVYLLAVEGDLGANPGVVQNRFDLAGMRVGGNGFLTLLQTETAYAPHLDSKSTTNMPGATGWGSGSSSSVGHKGNEGAMELNNPSVTLMLVLATNPPSAGEDLDAQNDGVAEGISAGGWQVWDSVGLLDADGWGDIAYGIINFRLSSAPGNAATSLGRTISIAFEPRYVARTGPGVGYTDKDWMAAGNLSGSAPAWLLGPQTWPGTFSGRKLDSIGSPNFGAPVIPGFVLTVQAGGYVAREGVDVFSYELRATTKPVGPVTISISADPSVLISTAGTNFLPETQLTITSTNVHSLRLKAQDDSWASLPWRRIRHRIASSADPRYSAASIIPDVDLRVEDNDLVLLNEVRINPPGTNDSPYEYVELRGTPNTWLSNTWLLAIDGRDNPGQLRNAWNLSGNALGSNGLLIVAGTMFPHPLPESTTVIQDPAFDTAPGALPNDALTLLLCATTNPPAMASDLDKGDNGRLEGMPADALILDSAAWGSSKNDFTYSPALLRLPGAVPDAAMRLSTNATPNTGTAWNCGDLAGSSPASLVFAEGSLTALAGSALSPGTRNNSAPWLSRVEPISGVLGYTNNPRVTLTYGDIDSWSSEVRLSFSSWNERVVPTTNLLVSAYPEGSALLEIVPVGIGYADIAVFVDDGAATNSQVFSYAASNPGRPGGTWHIGACDASSAIPVGNSFMLLADDENQVLRLYSSCTSGLPLEGFDFTTELQLPDIASGLPREVDIEASTRSGSSLLWIGSHGHSVEGESRTNRTRLFSTLLTGTGAEASVTYLGRYDYLKWDLIHWDIHNLHGRGSNYFGLEASDAEGVPPKAEDGSGFAIEGMAMLPGDTNAGYIAFRAPIVPTSRRQFALVVPVLNLVSLATVGGPPGSAVFGEPLEWDLYGRGVRSIEGVDGGYLVVAGPSGATVADYPRDFRLYTWSGRSADQPVERGADLSGLNPEGFIALPAAPWSEHSIVQVLSDNGTTVFYGDGVPAKALETRSFKKSRSDWLALGPAVIPPPIITEAAVVGDILRLTWRANKGTTYEIQGTGRMPGEQWRTEHGPIVATGTRVDATVLLRNKYRLYRVVAIAGAN